MRLQWNKANEKAKEHLEYGKAVKRILDHHLKRWGIPIPKKVKEYAAVLPSPPPSKKTSWIQIGSLPPVRVSREVQVEEEEVGKAASAVIPPQLSSVTVQMDPEEVGAESTGREETLVKRVESLLETRLGEFWRKVFELLPCGSGEGASSAPPERRR